MINLLTKQIDMIRIAYTCNFFYFFRSSISSNQLLVKIVNEENVTGTLLIECVQ